MLEREARAIAAAMAAHGVEARPADWAGGFWGVEADTPFATPRGRRVGLWLGSDDDGSIGVQYGDMGFGQYSDDYLEPDAAIADTDTGAAAAWAARLVLAHRAGTPMPEPFAAGFREAVAEEAAIPAEVTEAHARIAAALRRGDRIRNTRTGGTGRLAGTCYDGTVFVSDDFGGVVTWDVRDTEPAEGA